MMQIVFECQKDTFLCFQLNSFLIDIVFQGSLDYRHQFQTPVLISLPGEFNQSKNY